MTKSFFFIILFYVGTLSSSLTPDTLPGTYLQNAGECCDSSYDQLPLIYPGQKKLHHLYQFRLWLCSKGKQCSEIDSAIIQRNNLFLDKKRHDLPVNDYEYFGNEKATIKVVVFISMACPLCKRLYNELIDSLSVNLLGKKVAVTAVPFTNNETDRLYSAMFKWGKQVQLLRALQPVKERVAPELILTIADSLGVKKSELLNQAQTKEIIALTARSRDIGIAAGVKVTPTFFINGVRYSSYKDIRWILDYIDILKAAQ